VIHCVKETANICFDNPAIRPELKLPRQICGCALRASFRTIAVAAVQKILLIDCIEDIGDSPLNDLVFETENS